MAPPDFKPSSAALLVQERLLASSAQETGDPFRRDVAAALAHMVTAQDLLSQQQSWQTQQLCLQAEKLAALETKTDESNSKLASCEKRVEDLEAIPSTAKKLVDLRVAGGIGGICLALGSLIWGQILAKANQHIIDVTKPSIASSIHDVERTLSKQLNDIETKIDQKLDTKVDK
jgi:uncharacterized protein YjaG (DUF416 family)